MKRILSALLIGAFSITAAAGQLSQQEALDLGTEAYIFGYPLITMDMTRSVMTNYATPGTRGAPMGQFFHARIYPDASFKSVTAPNADTLYSIAWLDVSAEPYVLHVPDVGNRYYLMEMLNAWTDVFADPGSRTSGTKAHDFLITGPHWKGTAPQGMEVLDSDTDLVWIIGRTYCSGTREDYKAVHDIQDQYTLVPLSAYGKSFTPPPGQVDPKIDMKTPVRDQVNRLDAGLFLKKLAELMKNNPPYSDDAPMMTTLAKLGVEPGKDFDVAQLGSDAAIGLTSAVQAAQEKIMSHYYHAGRQVNGWRITTNTGDYGDDYIQRALMTEIGLGANLPEDAVYPMAKFDKDGTPLNGTNKYVMHFKKDKLPPVNGFWSLTMYNDQYFFVNNPINRYSISLRDNLKYNADGSLDIYIQHDSPGADKESNWLPAPQEVFILMMRLYWPKEAAISGSWVPPGVRKQ